MSLPHISTKEPPILPSLVEHLSQMSRFSGLEEETLQNLGSSCDISNALEWIKASYESILALHNLTSEIAELGKQKKRSDATANEVLFPIIHHPLNQTQRKNPTVMGIDKRALLIVTASHLANHLDSQLDWLTSFLAKVEVSINQEGLPNISDYFSYSNTVLSEEVAELVDNYELHLDARKGSLRVEFMGDSIKKSQFDSLLEDNKLEDKIYALELKLLKELQVLRFKSDLPQLVSAVSVAVSLNKEIINAAKDLYIGIGKLIRNIALGPKKETRSEQEGDSLNLCFIQRKSIQTASIPLKTFQNIAEAKDKEDILVDLLDSYLKLRQILSTAHSAWNKDLITNQGYNMESRKLDALLANFFPDGAKLDQQIVSALTSLGNKQVHRRLLNIATTEVHITNGKQLIIAEQSNIKMMQIVIDHLIDGNEEQAAQLSSSFQGGKFNKISEICSRIRKFKQSGDIVGLLRYIDIEIHKAQNSTGEYTVVAPIILSVFNLACDDNVRPYLKRLKSLNDYDSVIDKLAKKDLGSASADYLGYIREEVAHRVLPTLRNYYGHKQEVRMISDEVDEIIEAANNPEIYDSYAPGTVNENLILLHGPGGVGKTYLVDCLRNDKKLPIVRVSTKDMQAVYRKDSVTEAHAAEDLASAISAFMDKQIKAAEEVMNKTGEKVCIVFMDEVEAYFLERTLASSEQVHITDTMLQVIEEVGKKHPNIVFLAGTNHLKLLDSAATRPGRFGFTVHLGYVTQEDAPLHIEGNLKELGINVEEFKSADEKAYNELVLECSTDDVTPILISKAINRIHAQASRKANKGDKIDVSAADVLARLKVLKNARVN